MTSTTGMMAQTGGGGRKKSVRPSFIVYPLAKSRVVATLFSDFSPAAADFPTRRGFELLGMGMPQPVLDIEASDANDWFLMASPGNAEVIRVAFLGGQEEPELIAADGQSFGSMFTNDRIEVKGRHAYAVAAVDFVGIYGNNASA
jgi:hypothetical protein